MKRGSNTDKKTLAAFGCIHHKAAKAMVFVGFALSCLCIGQAYDDASSGNSFSEGVCRELGGDWVAHSYACCALPSITTMFTAALKMPRLRESASDC